MDRPGDDGNDQSRRILVDARADKLARGQIYEYRAVARHPLITVYGIDPRVRR